MFLYISMSYQLNPVFKSNQTLVALVEKLHKQFAHRISQRLKSLMKDAGINEASTLDLVDDVSDQCEICQRYKKKRKTLECA